jgi:hypothetical protein
VKIEINIAALGRSKWYEYLVRFAFGGLVTALTGIIAKRYGPGVGGLFLAFPAIFPATATLLEKHEKQKKERVGKAGILRAREIAGADAAGAAIGSLGLIVFAVIVWKGLPRDSMAVVLLAAILAWLLVSVTTWIARKTVWRTLRIGFFRKSTREPGLPKELSKNRRSHE